MSEVDKNKMQETRTPKIPAAAIGDNYFQPGLSVEIVRSS